MSGIIAMLKSFFSIGALVATASALLATTAQAEFITEQVTLNVRDPNGQGAFPAPVDPLTNIRRLDTSGGNVFTNQTSGLPFATGSGVRSLTASLLGTALDGEAFTPLVDNRAGTIGNDLIAISAVLGSITTGGAIAEASFTDGRTYIVSVAPGTFDPRNPSTWGWALGTFVELALADPENVVPGAGEPISFSASVMNTSSANTTASSQADGRFLFAEDSSAAQNLDPKGGDNWFTATTNTFGITTAFEGFVAQTSQTIEFADINAVGVATAGGPLLSGAALDAVDLAVMNAIFNDMLVESGLLADYGFATGFGGVLSTDFNPRWPLPVGDGPTGDFRGELQTRNAFGISNVPEPSSMVIFGLGLGIAGAYGRFGRRRKSS
jgi:hypothetical protein